jgi:hypothetical protein
MKRKDILKLLSLTPIFMNAQPLHELAKIFQELPKQGKKMPVLFTSHGIPMDIPVSRNERPFWKKLYELGIELQNEYGFQVSATAQSDASQTLEALHKPPGDAESLEKTPFDALINEEPLFILENISQAISIG